MRELIKRVCAVVIAAAFLVGSARAVTCANDGRPGGVWNSWPYTVPALGVGLPALGLLLWLHLLQRDRVPDYLRQVTRRYFERTGFCFTLVPVVVDGQCHMLVYFQSRRSAPSLARLIVEPTPGLFRTAELKYWELRVECPPAGFGMMSVPLAVPKRYQGTRQTFDVWASVGYPEGRGKMLRFRDGVPVGAAPDLDWVTPGKVVGDLAIGDMGIPLRPARIRLMLPTDVSETVPDNAPVVTDVIWKLGDPPLEASAVARAGAAASRA